MSISGEVFGTCSLCGASRNPDGVCSLVECPDPLFDNGWKKLGMPSLDTFWSDGYGAPYNLRKIAEAAYHAGQKSSAAPQMLEALEQADLQIEYMQSKFKETGTGNAVRAQIQAAIKAARGE